MAFAVRRAKIVGKRDAGERLVEGGTAEEKVPHVALDLREDVAGTTGSTVLLIVPEQGAPDYGAYVTMTFDLA